MTTLIKGQKVELTKTNPMLSNVRIGLGWESNKTHPVDLDVIALLVNSTGKIANKESIVYYNNLSSEGGGVQLLKDDRDGIGSGDGETVLINLKKLSPDIRKIIIAVNIHEAKENKQNFSDVLNSYARVVDDNNDKELYKYNLQDESHASTTILGEIYFYKNEWKFAAIGTGLQRGLTEFLSMFGFDEKRLDLVKPIPEKNTKREVIEMTNPLINLSKVELKKSGDKINLNKTQSPLGEILINLNWNQKGNQTSRGFFSSLFSGNTSIDLDLGCLYEMKNGSIGVVQALGNVFGDLRYAPYINLDQDDRTGESAGGENLRINGNKISEIKRILIFSFIYEGATNWSEVDGIVTLKQNNGPDIVVRLDNHRNGMSMCAIALIENMQNQTLSVQKIAKYYHGHQELDKAFNWGLEWVAGSK